MSVETNLQKKVLVVCLAGGEGKRILPLTLTRTKPAVPIGGKFRLIDIPLSNAANSGLYQCLILTQGKDKSLNSHIKNTWYSDRHYHAFIEIISPQGVGKAYRGDADAVRQVLDDIREIGPEYVLVVPGDHLLKMNYYDFVYFLANHDADAAISVIRKPIQQAGQLGSVKLDQNHYITDFREKDPDTPLAFQDEKGNVSFLASMGIYAFRTSALFESLQQRGSLFGKHIIPKILSATKILGYNYNENNVIMDKQRLYINDLIVETVEKSVDSEYWRDVGTIEEYFKANMDLTAITPSFNLYGELWPFFTCRKDLGPAKIIRSQFGDKIESLVVGEGSILSNVSGNMMVVSPQVFVDKSHLENVIIFQGSNVQNCRIKNTIIDKRVTLNDMTIGFDEDEDKKRGIYVDPHSKIRVVPKLYDYTYQWFKDRIPVYPEQTDS